jgi:GxxExxY protein
MSPHELSRIIVECAFAVHTNLGPGLLESAYEACLAHELRKHGLKVDSQVSLPLVYDGLQLDVGYRIDLLVEDLVIVEIKAVDAIAPIHQAQIISYLKLANKSLGLLINFHVPRLKSGIKRFVHGTAWNTRKPL